MHLNVTTVVGVDIPSSSNIGMQILFTALRIFLSLVGRTCLNIKSFYLHVLIIFVILINCLFDQGSNIVKKN